MKMLVSLTEARIKVIVFQIRMIVKRIEGIREMMMIKIVRRKREDKKVEVVLTNLWISLTFYPQAQYESDRSMLHS